VRKGLKKKRRAVRFIPSQKRGWQKRAGEPRKPPSTRTPKPGHTLEVGDRLAIGGPGEGSKGVGLILGKKLGCARDPGGRTVAHSRSKEKVTVGTRLGCWDPAGNRGEANDKGINERAQKRERAKHEKKQPSGAAVRQRTKRGVQTNITACPAEERTCAGPRKN